jgi:hypothetical protein
MKPMQLIHLGASEARALKRFLLVIGEQIKGIRVIAAFLGLVTAV